MGRRRKYFNEEEKKKADVEKALRYYYSNQEECNRKAKERYWAKKLQNGTNGSTTGSSEPEEVTNIPQLSVETDAK